MPKLQTSRLAYGGRINRQKPINFTFNNQRYQGYEGDTLASALLANGVHLVGRSMKFHRPRGIFSAGEEEPNALMKMGQRGREEPNVRATTQPLYQELVSASQNCWPSVNFDMGAVLDLTSGLWPAGFYNKMFMWPNWHWYEGSVRKASGLGTLPKQNDPDVYTHRNAHCDVLIVGSGPAGLSAALAAGKSGARVMLVEQDRELGGGLLSDDSDWRENTAAALSSMANVTMLTQATASGYFDHNLVMVSEKIMNHHLPSNSGPRECLWKIRAQEIILATGAIEQPMVFPNNDRPGIMLASAVRDYLNRYAVKVGSRVAVVTNNDSAYQTAFDLKAVGVAVPCIIDSRPEGTSQLVKQAIEQGITVYENSVPFECKGKKRVSGIQVGQRDGVSVTAIGQLIKCDAVAVSGGWQPAVHLLSHARGKVRYDEQVCAFVPDYIPEHIHLAGSVMGAVGLKQSLYQGESVGTAAAKAVGYKAVQVSNLSQQENQSFATQRYIPSINPAKQWVDFQHDVTLRDVNIAVQEDYVSVEHLKRYTTTGMSVDQGKTSNINALTALAERTGKPVSEVGTTTFRPFYMPVTLGAITGRRNGERYAAIRRTPMHHQHEEAGAVLWDYGHWKRPAAFPIAEETLGQAMIREAASVRASVGVYDGSPLGKIELRGSDAAEFLNRFYINNVLTLKVGRARYGIMLDESGIVIDDGIFVCLAENHYLVHTTSGNAERILAWMEEWQQCEWPDLDVLICPVTTQWANATISGPNSRKLLQKLGTDIDLDNETFPHMSLREGTIAAGEIKIPVRVMRASFTGEMGYEINVPASYGAALWQNLLEAGEEFNISRYGVESLMILRSEKGYLHVGVDTDGTTVPDDIGWGGPVKNKKADFIGKRSLSLPDKVRADRIQYVGFELLDKNQKVLSGAHVLNADVKQAPAETQGYVTSAFYSPTLECCIALGLVKAGRNRIGEAVNLYHAGKTQPARIVEPVFFDNKGGRLHV